MQEFYLVEVSYFSQRSNERVSRYLKNFSFLDLDSAEKFETFDEAAGRLDWLMHNRPMTYSEARILHFKLQAAHKFKLPR